MKVFDRVAAVVAVIMLAAVIAVAAWKGGYTAALAAIGAASAVAMLWNSCASLFCSRNGGESPALQITIDEDENCSTKFNASLYELRMYIPAAIASVVQSAEMGTDGRIDCDDMIEQARAILRGEHEGIRIRENKED